MVVLRHHPVGRALAERRRDRGTRPLVLVGAALRPLLHRR
jgi:hypothetical protein